MSEVHLTQYMFPDGRTKPVTVDIGPEYAERAKGMVLRCECQCGEVTLYGRLITDKEEDEHIEFAENGPGLNSPPEATKRLIDVLHSRRAKVRS